MTKLLIVFLLIATLACTITALNEGCPLSSKHTTCSSKCIQDVECSSMGGICCPNLCNTKSCIRPKNGFGNAGSTGNKGSSSATGTYCGQKKCNNYEKCEMDRSTKLLKCVRT